MLKQRENFQIKHTVLLKKTQMRQGHLLWINSLGVVCQFLVLSHWWQFGVWIIIII